MSRLPGTPQTVEATEQILFRKSVAVTLVTSSGQQWAGQGHSLLPSPHYSRVASAISTLSTVCSRDRRLVSEYKKRDHLWVVVSRSHLITSLITTITREVSTLPSYKNYKLWGTGKTGCKYILLCLSLGMEVLISIIYSIYIFRIACEESNLILYLHISMSHRH